MDKSPRYFHRANNHPAAYFFDSTLNAFIGDKIIPVSTIEKNWISGSVIVCQKIIVNVIKIRVVLGLQRNVKNTTQKY